MKNCLKPVVSAELLVDRVEVVSQGWQRDSEFLSNLPRVLRLRKKRQDAVLLIR